jgi:AbrB family looped-hinge helix DNA binding protein
MQKKNIVAISKKGQLLIPKLYRQKSGIKPGSRVALAAEPNKITLTVLPEDPVAAACGILNTEPSLSKKLMDERDAEIKKEKKRIRR